MNYVFDLNDVQYDENTICSYSEQFGVRLICQNTHENRIKLENNIKAHGSGEKIVKFSEIVKQGLLN